MNESRKVPSTQRHDAKTLLSALKVTTTIGAVSLTLAGWGMLSRVEANNIAQAAQPAPTGFLNASLTNPTSTSTPIRVKIADATAAQMPTAKTVIPQATPTAASLPAAIATDTPVATDTPTATDTPAPLVKLDVVQWVQTQAGDPVAVVRDNRGTLWFVMGTDVPRIEQGLKPEFQPQPVNGMARSRAS